MTFIGDNTHIPAWEVAGEQLFSRCILGSGGMVHIDSFAQCVQASGCEVVTVSMRRVGHDPTSAGLLQVIERLGVRVLPNTAGSLCADDAVLTAKLAREALGTSWVKLEVVADSYTHVPDTRELLIAAEQLVDDGFAVFAYTNDDPVVARHLARIGCSAIMPGAAPIGTGLGVLNPYNLAMIVQESPVPVIVDAGIGTASDAAIAMELGATAVLVATAVHGADHPQMMARALALAAQAGYYARYAGRIERREIPCPSSSSPDFL